MSYSQSLHHLPNRHQDLPTVYKVENHPLLEGVHHVRNVYVGYMRTDKKSVKACLDFEKALQCPAGDVVEWESQGLLQLEPGDYFFYRDPIVSEEAKDDVLVAMVTGWAHHDAAVLTAYEVATQAILGEAGARTASSTAFERTLCARKIRKKRCYSVGVAVQLSRRVVAPSASLAQDHAQIGQYQKMVNDLLLSTADMLLDVQDVLPAGCADAFIANAELTGQPGMGRKNVFGTSSVQINISAAGLSSTDNRLASQLGDFGCEHYDRRDSPDHFTTMFASPDIPTYYKSGAFHILQPGIFVVLNKNVGVTFSGHRRHVGTAPTPPIGFPAVESAYRLNVVCYPKDAAVDGLSRLTLASLPGKKQQSSTSSKSGINGRLARKAKAGRDEKGKGKQAYTETDDDLNVDPRSEVDDESDEEESEEEYHPGALQKGRVKGMKKGKRNPHKAVKEGPGGGRNLEPLYITPEMININDEGFVPHSTNRATFARSGHVMMDRSSHVTFMARALHQLNTYVWRQLPPQYAVHIDTEKLFESMSFEDENGDRIQLSAWSSAPNVHSVSAERKKNKEIWNSYCENVRRFIPRIAYRAFTYDGEDGQNEIDLDREGSGGESGDEDEDNAGDGEKEHGERRDGALGERQRSCPNDWQIHVEDGGDGAGGKQGLSPGDQQRRREEGDDGAGKSQRSGPDDPQARELEEASIATALLRTSATQQELAIKAISEVQAFRVVLAARDDVAVPAPSFTKRNAAGGSEGAIAGPQESSPNKRALTSDVPADTQNSGKRRKVDPEVGPASSIATTAAKYPFLENLTTEVLRTETEELRRDFSLVLAQAPTDEYHEFNLRHLVDAYQSVLQDPTSHLAPGRIRQIQVQLRAHTMSSAFQAVALRWERYTVLLSSVHVWYWLDVVIKKKVETILERELSPGLHDDCEWLRVLVSLTKSALESKNDPIILNPFVNLSLFTLRSGMITVANRHKRTFLQGDPDDQAALVRAVISTVQMILIDCLEFPSETDIKERRKAWLMGTLAEVLGVEFLATQYAWSAWKAFSVKNFLGQTPQAYTQNSDLIQPFKDALLNHPICQIESDAWRAYNSFRRCLTDRSQYTTDRSRSVSQHGLPSGPSNPTTAISVRQSEGTPIAPMQFAGLDAYLRSCLEYTRGTASTDPAVHDFLQDQPDCHIPFREKAPSRIHILAAGSPYSSATIRTNAGIYSAVMYRGVTYNTRFSQHPDSPMVFQDFEDWTAKIDKFKTDHPSISHTKNFFCRPDAYGGQSIRGRGVKLAQTFWEDVQALSWPQQTEQVMTFEKCFRLFRNGGFPTMGNLCCYLLVCDLHYAGVCEAPTIRDVARFVRRQRGGSYHILPSLGYGTVDVHPTEELVTAALTTVDAHLREVFAEEERRFMGFDLICVEHILCKYKRAVTAKVAL